MVVEICQPSQAQDNAMKSCDVLQSGLANRISDVEPIGLEHFDEVVERATFAAKSAGAKSVKFSCLLVGEIIL